MNDDLCFTLINTKTIIFYLSFIRSDLDIGGIGSVACQNLFHKRSIT